MRLSLILPAFIGALAFSLPTNEPVLEAAQLNQDVQVRPSPSPSPSPFPPLL